MVTNESLREFTAAVVDAIDVPNSWLPVEYQDKRRRKEGYTGLDFIRRKLRKNKKIASEHQDRKAIKLSNIEQYRQQVERGEEIQYNENSTKLDRNLHTFYDLMDRAGHFEGDEFDVE